MFPKQLLLILLAFFPAILTAQIQHFTNRSYDFDGDGGKDFIRKDEYFHDIYNHIYQPVSKLILQNNAEIAFIENYVDNYALLTTHFLEFNDTISAKLNWTEKFIYIHHSRFDFANEYKINKDYFFAVRIKKENTYHYGWIRFRGGENGGLRDAAVQLTPDKPILAGEGINSIETIVDSVLHQQNNNRWSDYTVRFFPPYNEEYINEYRLFISKANDIDELTTEKLAAISGSNHQKVIPGSKTFEISLNDNLKDLDGEGIKQGGEYRVIVLSISNDTTAFSHVFNVTQPFIVETKLPKPGAPLVLDYGDGGTSKDILLTFKSNYKESLTDSYLLMIIPQPEADTFNFKKVLNIAPANILEVPPKGDSVYQVNTTSLTDIYGKPVLQNEFYKAFVYAAPDGIQSTVGALSEASNLFYLSNPGQFYAGQIEGPGIDYFLNDSNTISQTSYLDIDRDGEADLKMTAHVDATWYKYDYDFKYLVHTSDSTEVLVDAKMNDFAQNNKIGEPIFEARHWGAGEILLTRGSTERGEINGAGNFSADFFSKGILGFRKITKNDTLYGWVNIHTYIGTRFDEFAVKNVSELLPAFYPDSIETSFISFPNPSPERIINVAIKNFKEIEDYYIDVLNSSGNQIKSLKANDKLVIINLSGMQKGIYFVRLRTTGEQETQKIILY